MLSKSQISFIKSLHQKKYRKESGLFIIEGIKSLLEFVDSRYHIQSIYYLPQYQSLLPKFGPKIELFEVNNAELSKISTLQAPPGVLAVLKGSEQHFDEPSLLRNTFSIALDGVQDP